MRLASVNVSAARAPDANVKVDRTVDDRGATTSSTRINTDRKH
jgi:hypothetical protein